jgi:corticotropin releasing hormone receptor 1
MKFLILSNVFYRKAVKAAVFLLPLLGTTHMLETFVSPGKKIILNNIEIIFFLFSIEDHQSIPLFAIYCSVTYFLVTFQGFFCSLLYCFLNTEVNLSIN